MSSLEVTVFLNIGVFLDQSRLDLKNPSKRLIRTHVAYVNKPLQQTPNISLCNQQAFRAGARITKTKTGRYTTDSGKDALVPSRQLAKEQDGSHGPRVTLKCNGMNKTWFSLPTSISNICYSYVFMSENILLENSLHSCVATRQMLTVSLGSRNVSNFYVLLCIWEKFQISTNTCDSCNLEKLLNKNPIRILEF